MSELMNAKSSSAHLRREFLTTASVLILIGAVSGVETGAAADDGGHPTVWIELGGQLERLNADSETYTPPFVGAVTQAGFAAPSVLSYNSKYGIGVEGSLSFEPRGSDWLFDVSMRYGRSKNAKNLHEEAKTQVTNVVLGQPKYSTGVRYADAIAQRSESHLIFDFKAGRDVGLGIFGRNGTSIVNAGIRFAQFSSHSADSLNAKPTYFVSKFVAFPFSKYQKVNYHNTFHGHETGYASFRGLGPSFSWNVSSALSGDEESGEIALDWGVNVAALFGRQKATVHHQTTKNLYDGRYAQLAPNFGHSTVYQNRPADQNRNRSVIVPNLGAFAGFSMRYPGAKVSLGYRADFFFGAMDGGINTRKTYDRNFYGPFATISIGLGG